MLRITGIMVTMVMVVFAVSSLPATYTNFDSNTTYQTSGWWCQDWQCEICVDNAAIKIGDDTGYQGYSHGLVTGGISVAGTEINGIMVPPRALPRGSLFKIGLAMVHQWGESHCTGCYGYSCPAFFQINGASGALPMSETSASWDLAFTPGGIQFTFNTCNTFISLGAGCGVVGSAGRRLELETIVTPYAVDLPNGDAPPTAFPGTGVSIDKSSGEGGVVTAATGTGAPPVAWDDPNPTSTRYWDINHAINGSFVCDLQIQYSLADLPASVEEEYLALVLYDEEQSDWIWLDTVIDPVNHLAITEGLSQLSLVLLAQYAVSDVEVPDLSALKIISMAPNPFNPTIEVSYSLPEAGQVKLGVYDITGRLVKILVDTHVDAGIKTERWNGVDQAGNIVASGTYFLRLETHDGVRARKVMLAK